MRDAILIDIDNCWMDSRLWLSKIPSDNASVSSWDIFYKRVYLCKPNKSFIKDIMSLISEKSLYPIFITSRTSKIKGSTVFQIQNNSNLVVGETCLLLMRDGHGPLESSSVVKEELLSKVYNEYNIVYAIDDLKENLDMYKKHNIDTVILYDINLHDYERL